MFNSGASWSARSRQAPNRGRKDGGPNHFPATCPIDCHAHLLHQCRQRLAVRACLPRVRPRYSFIGFSDLIDLHSHILPGLDDGAPTVEVSLAMARAAVENGVTVLACTPHIMPGVWNNSGPQIRQAVEALKAVLADNGVNLNLTTGADVHIAPNLVGAIRSGQVLTLHDTRYVLLELPHHIAPPRADTCFMQLLDAGYVPIFTHPERLSWVQTRYNLIVRLFEAGVWMQITAGSLIGRFGKRAQLLSERMLRDGFVHILASDAHNLKSRPPNLASGWEAARSIVGEDEAYRLVVERPYGILRDDLPAAVIAPRPLAREGKIASTHGQVAGNVGADRAARSAQAGTSLFDRIRGYLKLDDGPRQR